MINHIQKTVRFRTPHSSTFMGFKEYDEWNTIEVDGIKTDVHVHWDGDLTVYLEPITEDTDTGLFSYPEGGIEHDGVFFTMSNPKVREIGVMEEYEDEEL